MRTSQIGVCSWSLQSTDPDSLLTGLRGTGLSGVQLALSPLVEAPEIWAGTVEKLREAGIEILSGMMAMAGEDYSSLQTIAQTGGVRPDETWATNRAHAEAVAAAAREAGIGLVTFHAGFIPEEADDHERDKLIGRLRDIADVFAACGVNLAFETGQETAVTLLEALAELNAPNVGVNFDPANMILYGKGDPVEALGTLSPLVRQIHIKDALPSGTPGSWGTEVAVGSGGVDWPAFFAIAKTIEPPVDFIIEREAGGSRVQDIVAAQELVNLHLRKVM